MAFDQTDKITIEDRMADALSEVDSRLKDGERVAVSLAKSAEHSGLPLSVLRVRAERQFGPLLARKQWHALKRRSQINVAAFLNECPIDSNHDNLCHVEMNYSSFLGRKYKKKASAQDQYLAEGLIREAYLKDYEEREADRKARGVKLVKRY